MESSQFREALYVVAHGRVGTAATAAMFVAHRFCVSSDMCAACRSGWEVSAADR